MVLSNYGQKQAAVLGSLESRWLAQTAVHKDGPKLLATLDDVATESLLLATNVQQTWQLWGQVRSHVIQEAETVSRCDNMMIDQVSRTVDTTIEFIYHRDHAQSGAACERQPDQADPGAYVPFPFLLTVSPTRPIFLFNCCFALSLDYFLAVSLESLGYLLPVPLRVEDYPLPQQLRCPKSRPSWTWCLPTKQMKADRCTKEKEVDEIDDMFALNSPWLHPCHHGRSSRRLQTCQETP
ncbi:uncharacterized protein J3D65DRAFT_309887 [Phyllosticta citribraziliensis]|uniref:Uncharacterized protein n=1 Tax=Phyllosticta citribraziliensis TaxID=989973 RepID=A0ABR1M175_9PEZI